jgi:hypothetical protein
MDSENAVCNLPYRFNSLEGKERFKEIRQMIDNNKEITGVINKNNHPHGYDCQSIIVELRNGELWFAASTDFGGEGYTKLEKNNNYSLERMYEILTGRDCTERKKSNPNYGRYCRIFCVCRSGEIEVEMQDLLTTSEILGETDKLLQVFDGQ